MKCVVWWVLLTEGPELEAEEPLRKGGSAHGSPDMNLGPRGIVPEERGQLPGHGCCMTLRWWCSRTGE